MSVSCGGDDDDSLAAKLEAVMTGNITENETVVVNGSNYYGQIYLFPPLKCQTEHNRRVSLVVWSGKTLTVILFNSKKSHHVVVEERNDKVIKRHKQTVKRLFCRSVVFFLQLFQREEWPFCYHQPHSPTNYHQRPLVSTSNNRRVDYTKKFSDITQS